ncbi:uncharacterized protein LOC131635916 [Vicia villosa]|uniref:uncharacterized protein LOC131635916 n=1 Tax=Vicia villosa TaxID=3911 RepID=UPI00273C84B4|nr:uncharacterized protein LOC131635916 [Vicia villosa]
MRRVRAAGSISLNPGSLKLFAWTRDFNQALQNNTSAQVWVRFFRLSQEYWRPRILFAIASCVGTPICIDSASAKSRIDRTFGQFVRVLIDMDLSLPLNHNVLVEREGFAFFSDIEYENLPALCSHCRKTGHIVQECKMLGLNFSSGIQKNLETKNQKPGTIPPETVANDGEQWVEVGKKKASRPVITNPDTVYGASLDHNPEDSTRLVSVEPVRDPILLTDTHDGGSRDLVTHIVGGPILEPVTHALVEDILEPVKLVPARPDTNFTGVSKAGFGYSLNCVNSQNFVVQPSDDSESSLSVFVEATQNIPTSNNEDFLQDSWATLGEAPNPVGAFSSAVAVLKKKKSSKVKKKDFSRSQAGPKKSSL